jgi:hypothetical protein
MSTMTRTSLSTSLSWGRIVAFVQALSDNSPQYPEVGCKTGDHSQFYARTYTPIGLGEMPGCP